MTRFALAALLIATGVAAAAPASAQYYGGGGGYGGGGYGGGGGYNPDYDRPRRRPPPDYDPGYGQPRPYVRRGGSSICVTSRGNCPIGAIVPRNSPCGCEVPGFGYKRGAAG